MDCAIQLRQFFHFSTRRLVLAMGIIFGFALLLQSSVLPTQNVLSSLFPTRVITLFGRNISISPNSLIDSNSTESNNSIASDTPLVHSIANSTDYFDPAKPNVSNEGTKIYGTPRGSTYKSESIGVLGSPLKPSKGKNLGNVTSLDENNSTLENVSSSYNVSISVSSSEPYNSPSAAIGSTGNVDTGVLTISPASPPEASRNNLTSLGMSDSYSTVSQVQEMPSEIDSPELLRSSPLALNDTIVILGNPMMRNERATLTPISKMNNLLLHIHDSFHSMRPLWPSDRDQELLFAKSQIMNSSSEYKDPELCPSVFRNFSMFKRSYELMENILKIYIYKEGEKPIFHKATDLILKGIYASEGWFMRLMEKNKMFVVDHPSKAHLFYMPFSSRMLQLMLYVRNSHKRENLADHLRKYVNMIATNHPFWNRTGGADHFLVACHDWAPFETRHHLDNCIKVLCNANAARDFKIGKDVTLPETQVRNVNDPLQGLGGNLPSERPILAFFAGGMHGDLRPNLLRHWGNKDSDMKIFGQMPQGNMLEGKTYIEYMKSSKYCICPRGYDVNSPRVVEAIFFECIPVFLSDDYVPPFFEIFNWEAFAVFVPEKDVPKLKEILLSISYEKYLEMQVRVKKVQKHFLWHMEPIKYDLFHMILHSVWYNRLNQL